MYERQSMKFRITLMTLLSLLLFTMLACDDDEEGCALDSVDPIVMLVDDNYLAAGVHEITWNQTNSQGQQVAAGNYKVLLCAEQYSTYMPITIQEPDPMKILTQYEDTSTTPTETILPDSYGMSLEKATYAYGEAVIIAIMLPKASDGVKLGIARD